MLKQCVARSLRGTVKNFGTMGPRGPRSFGFITLESGAEHFCHVKALAPELGVAPRRGQRVIVDLILDPRGGAPVCDNVRPDGVVLR